MRSSHRGQSTASHRPTRPQARPHRLQLPQAPLTPPHTPVQVVSEYGTHWNFFFTLALVAAAAAVATPASARATALCAAALLLLHQAALLCGLAQWVEHAPRRGLLSANKVWRAPASPAASRRARARALPDQPAPGCARSAAGGAGLPTRLPRRLVAWRRRRRGLAPARRGSQLVARPGGARPPHPRAGRRRAAHASAPRTPRPAAHACGGADAWVGGPTLPPAVRSVIHCRRRGAAGVATAVQPGLLALGRRAGAQSARAQLHARAPSRCACSPQTLLVLCICLATSLVCPAPAPDLLGALNRHLLGVFLLANLLTGAVNLTLPTMHASGPFGLCVLCVYMTAVCAAACAAEGPRRDATVRASP